MEMSRLGFLSNPIKPPNSTLWSQHTWMFSCFKLIFEIPSLLVMVPDAILKNSGNREVGLKLPASMEFFFLLHNIFLIAVLDKLLRSFLPKQSLTENIQRRLRSSKKIFGKYLLSVSVFVWFGFWNRYHYWYHMNPEKEYSYRFDTNIGISVSVSVLIWTYSFGESFCRNMLNIRLFPN